MEKAQIEKIITENIVFVPGAGLSGIGEAAAKIAASIGGESMYPISKVKEAFETFHYRPFPHNSPTWEEWKTNNL